MYKIISKRNEKIVISGKFLMKSFDGVPRYATEILKRLDETEKSFEIILCCPVEVKKQEKSSYKNIRQVYIGRNCSLWDAIYGSTYARRNKALYINFANVGVPYRNSVVCIHDIYIFTWYAVNDVKVKKIWYQKIKLWLALKFSRQIVTISEFTHQELVEYCNYRKDIIVAPNGWEHVNQITDIIHPPFLPESKEFYFAIGGRKPHKNYVWIEKVAERNPDICFLIAGSPATIKSSEENNKEKLSNLKLLGHISDEDMKWYMRNAKALLFPSFVEGFGIPPLEALALGTEVIASDIPVIHEIYGNTVHYIDPYKYDINLDEVLSEEVDPPVKVLKRCSWDNVSDVWMRIIKDNLA